MNSEFVKEGRIDGKAIADTVRKEVAEAVKQLGIKPGLAVVIVGGRKDSETYVRMKEQAATDAGFHFVKVALPEDVTQQNLLAKVNELNSDPKVHGLIVQLPLPAHINEKEILDAVSYTKDVDGFHPLNIGGLTMKGREPRFIPGTPKGCMEILKRIGVDLTGKDVVVLGRSNIVGIPMAMLCLHADATVTICTSKTVNLSDKTRRADILVAAVGRPQMIKGDDIKEGAIVIDVGINSIEDSSRKLGYRLVGDVDYESCKKKALAITPVPGGVGPMTVAMLLTNTLDAARRTLQPPSDSNKN